MKTPKLCKIDKQNYGKFFFVLFFFVFKICQHTETAFKSSIAAGALLEYYYNQSNIK